jgi:GGDEF domain-containing protein
MSPAMPDPGQLVALGGFAGVLVLVVCFSVFDANVYRERGLLMHAGASMLGVIAIGALEGNYPVVEASMLGVLALSAMHLRELLSHAGALVKPRLWLIGISLGLLPALALVSAFAGLHVLLPGAAAWAAVVIVLMLRAWPQSQPWARWLAPGLACLATAAAWLGWRQLDREPDPSLPLAALLALWSALVYLASIWRSRIFSETRLRVEARNTVDPLTGLATPLVLYERVQAARSLMRRYGHPSVLMLVHIDNLRALQAEFGPEVAESAMLAAANRIRQALGEGGVAARLPQFRLAVLAEGMAVAEGASNVASRILVAGLKEPLAAARSEFLHFRIVLAAVPVEPIPAKAILQQMAARMEMELAQRSERRIVTLAAEEVAADRVMDS